MRGGRGTRGLWFKVGVCEVSTLPRPVVERTLARERWERDEGKSLSAKPSVVDFRR